MHKIDLPQWATDIALERRGKAHIYADLDPRKTALIVVDLQNGFMDEEVAIAYVPIAVEIVPNVNWLAAAVRRTGGKVFWIKNTFDETNLKAWSEYFTMLTPAKRARAILEQLGLEVDVGEPVAALGVAEQQLVEIAKGLLKNA